MAKDRKAVNAMSNEAAESKDAKVIDFEQEIYNLDGTRSVGKDSSGRDLPAFTLGKIATDVLMGNKQNDTGVDKIKKFNLGLRIMNEKRVSLDSEDVTLIKQLIAETHGPLIVGQTSALLELRANPLKPTEKAA